MPGVGNNGREERREEERDVVREKWREGERGARKVPPRRRYFLHYVCARKTRHSIRVLRIVVRAREFLPYLAKTPDGASFPNRCLKIFNPREKWGKLLRVSGLRKKGTDRERGREMSSCLPRAVKMGPPPPSLLSKWGSIKSAAAAAAAEGE